MEKETKEVSKKRLSPESTILLTIGGVALITVVCGVIHFIMTSL